MRPMTAVACLGTIVGSLILLPADQAEASVIPPRIAQLVDKSERIVLAKVESVQSGPGPEIRQARATVKEVWKGPKVETVEYRITPGFACDITEAVIGETVLLFLVKEESGWGSAWAGRGRMTLETLNTKEHLSYFNDVIFPDDTHSITFSDDKKAGFDRGVELKLVKELVDKAMAAGKK